MNPDGQVSGMGDVDSVGIASDTLDTVADPEVITRLDTISTALTDIHTANTDFYSSALSSTELIIVMIALMLGLIIGYIAVRGFFDSWTT